MAPPDRTALVVVDVQRAFEDAAYWGRRNNPACEANVARLIAAWREADAPIVFVRHDSDEEVSPLRPDHPGNAFKPEVTGEPDLAAWLRGEDLDGIAICGITTNHCCETTARVGANVGFDVLFVLDATHTFDREGPDGTVMTADELARATATSLHGEFAQVVDTADVIGSR